MFARGLRPDAQVGITMKWNISNFYTFNKTKKQIQIGRQLVSTGRETFLFNMDQLTGQNTENIAQYRAMMKKDEQIIALVIVAFCVPATLKKGTGYYLERIRQHINQFPVIDIDKQHNTIVLTNDQIHTLKSIESAADKMISPLQDLEDNLHSFINYLVIPR